MDTRRQFKEAERQVAAGDLSAALDLFRSVAAATPTEAAPLVRAGHLLLRLERPVEAIDALREAVARNADNATGWFLFGEALAGLAVDPEADPEVDDGTNDAAGVAFEHVIRLRPDFVPAHANLAVVRRRSGDQDGAVSSLLRAAELDPGDPRRHEALGTALHGAGRMERAIQTYRRHVLLSPDSATARDNMGATLPLLGDRDAGLRQLEIAVHLKPGGETSWRAVARAAMRAGAVERCIQSWRRAVLWRPDAVDPSLALPHAPWPTAELAAIWSDRARILASSAPNADELAAMRSISKEIRYQDWIAAAEGAPAPSAEASRISVLRIGEGSPADLAEFVLFLAEGDQLAPGALTYLGDYVARHPDAVLIYGDEDQIGLDGQRHDRHFKSDWNPELLECWNYLGAPVVYRREVLSDADIRSAEQGASWEHDLALRVTSGLDPLKIHHIPRILAHRPAQPTGWADPTPVMHQAVPIPPLGDHPNP